MVKPVLLLAFIAIFSCSKEADTYEDPKSTDLQADQKNNGHASDESAAVSITTLASFDAAAMELPESIAVDRHGNIYLSMSPLREIWKLDSEGNFTGVFASFSLEPGLFGVSGIRFDNKDNLYVVISSTRPEMKGVWKIDQQGEKERVSGSDNLILPNDVAVLPNGTIYITDSATGSVWRSIPGEEAELWAQDVSLEGTGALLGIPIGANGIVVTRRSDEENVGAVVVSNTEKGQLVSIPIQPDGSAGEPEIVIAGENLFGLDGLVLDPQGNVYGAVNAHFSIVKIDRDGELTEIAAGPPLDFPTSLAFGTGRDKHSLFVSNFSAIHFLGNPPMPEVANPAVIALDLKP